MRRASSKFLSRLQNPHPETLISLAGKDFSTTAAATYDQSHPLTSPSKTHLKPRSNLFNTTGPSQSFNTLPDPVAQHAPQMSSRQRKIKQKSDLEEAFESAGTIEEMLLRFKEMEPRFEEKDLGMACLKIGLKLDREGKDPQQTLSFAQRALRSFEDNDGRGDGRFSLPIVMSLQLLGSCCFGLKWFSESLAYLNRANRLLSKLQGEGSYGDEQLLPILHAVHSELFNVKTGMGRREEGLEHLRKALDIKERTLEEGSKELGKAYRDMAEAYYAALNFKEALPFCLKALDIHMEELGPNSVEVAYDRRLLGLVYSGLEDHGEALEQNQLSQKVLKKWGHNSDLLRAEMESANMQLALGRFEEAISTLKGVVLQTDKDSEDRAIIFTSMAKALYHLNKLDDAKKCLDMAVSILDKKESGSAVVVSEALTDVAMQYEAMNELETAISLLKRTLNMLEKLPQEQHSVGTVAARIGWLLLLTGKVEEAIPYLEEAVESLKVSFGPKHYGVGYVYNNMGAAYLELERPQSAAQVFAIAKDILEVSLGPSHVDTIETFQNLARAYAAMGSYPLAITFQEKVVEAWEGHGSSAEDELKEAIRVLKELKLSASIQVRDTLMEAMPLPEDEEAGAFPADELLDGISSMASSQHLNSERVGKTIAPRRQALLMPKVKS